MVTSQNLFKENINIIMQGGNWGQKAWHITYIAEQALDSW